MSFPVPHLCVISGAVHALHGALLHGLLGALHVIPGALRYASSPMQPFMSFPASHMRCTSNSMQAFM